MGADDFIRKPFSQRLLTERVKVVLRRSSPKDGSLPKEADSKVLDAGNCAWIRNATPAPGKTSR